MMRHYLLFVCVENSNRSQMAEAFARLHGGQKVVAWSAGSRPSGTVNPRAMAAMKDKGVDLSSHWSKSLNDLPEVTWDRVITMGCGDTCPNLPARRRDDWPLPDPRNMEPGEFNKVRDEIELRVKNLLLELEGNRA